MGLDIEARTYPLGGCWRCIRTKHKGDGVALVRYRWDADAGKLHWSGRAICLCCGIVGIERHICVDGVEKANLEDVFAKTEHMACDTLWYDFRTPPEASGVAPLQEPEPPMESWTVEELCEQYDD